jgi:hypothetical protein
MLLKATAAGFLPFGNTVTSSIFLTDSSTISYPVGSDRGEVLVFFRLRTPKHIMALGHYKCCGGVLTLNFMHCRYKPTVHINQFVALRIMHEQ